MKMKFFLASSLVVGSLFVGCTDKDSDAACRFESSQLLDKGKYDAAISEISSCSGFNANEKSLNLGAAYMGKAGITTTSVIQDLSDEDSDFIQVMARNASSEKLFNIETANDNFTSIFNDDDSVCSTDVNLQSKDVQSACFSSGLASLVLSTSSIGLAFGDEETLNAYLNEDTYKNKCTAQNVDQDSDLDDSEALEDGTKTLNGDPITSGNTVNNLGTVQINSSDYRVVQTTIASSCAGLSDSTISKVFLTTVPVSVLTDGFCNATGDTCTKGAAGCYPCPVKDSDGEVKTMSDTIATALNGGVDKISGSGDSSVNEDTQDVKEEICLASGKAASVCADPNYEVTADDVTAYIVNN